MNRIKYIVCIGFLLLTACMGGRETDQAQDSTPEDSDSVLSEDSQEESSPKEEDMQPAHGGTLYMTMQNQSVYNPLLVTDESAAQVLNLLFSPLIDFDGSCNPHPSIASAWEISEDNQMVTLTIDTSIRWQNGEPVTPQDVAYTISILQEVEDSVYKSCVEDISAVSVVDAQTVEITFSRSSPFNLNRLYFPVISKDYYNKPLSEGLGNITAPMGTGPFCFEAYESMQSITLRANSEYFGGEPYIDTVVIHLTRSDARITSFDQGLSNLVYVDNMNWGSYLNRQSIKLHVFGTHDAVMLVYNTASGVMAEADTRKAIAYALDAPAILKNVNLDKGDVTEVPLPPESWYAPTNPNRYAYNQQKVAELLDLSQELTVRLLANRDEELEYDIAEEIGGALEKQGILVESELQSEDAYQTALSSGEFDIALTTVSISDERELRYLLTQQEPLPSEEEDAETSSSLANYAGYESERMQELLDAVGHENQEQQIHQALVEVAGQVEEDLPYYTLFFLRQATLTGSGVYGELEPTCNNVYRGVEKLFMEYTTESAS